MILETVSSDKIARVLRDWTTYSPHISKSEHKVQIKRATIILSVLSSEKSKDIITLLDIKTKEMLVKEIVFLRFISPSEIADAEHKLHFYLNDFDM